MRSSPTPRAFRVALMGGAGLVGIALMACSSGGREGDEATEVPATSTSSNEPVPEAGVAPEFEADFGDEPSTADAGGGPIEPSPNGEQCLDANDPGGAENLALELPPTDDCDTAYKTVAGVSKGAVDVDFYKLTVTDKLLCSLDMAFEAQTPGTEVCVYARCKNSTANAVSGCDEGLPTTSSLGLKGCCTTGPGSAVPKWDCSGILDDDSADFFIRVRQVDGDVCLPYKVRYRF
ncbi:MAG TPA: hypothetical protein VM580_12715 [Labilithrix sp.]|nr:hypothetical protein [Labilithrix sp.]